MKRGEQLHIGTLKITLYIPENNSLKGKRHIVKSVCDRLQSKFRIAVAEVDNLDKWQLATIGIAIVGNETKHLTQLLSQIQNFLAELQGEFQLTDAQQKIIII